MRLVKSRSYGGIGKDINSGWELDPKLEVIQKLA